MNNHEKISLIEQIVQPYFNFEMDDLYGDRGGLPYPNIEELTHLYFKKNGKDRKLVLSKSEEQLMLDKIKNLNIGEVKLIQIPSFGIYIHVKLDKITYKNYSHILNIFIDEELCETEKNVIISTIFDTIHNKRIVKNISGTDIPIKWEIYNEKDLLHYYTDVGGMLGDYAVHQHTKILLEDIRTIANRERISFTVTKPLTQQICLL
jgi:hypothetical protein